MLQKRKTPWASGKLNNQQQEPPKTDPIGPTKRFKSPGPKEAFESLKTVFDVPANPHGEGIFGIGSEGDDKSKSKEKVQA